MTDAPELPPDGDVLVATGGDSNGPTGGYPVSVEAEHLPEYSRFMPLIKWFLLIPHFIALTFLGLAAIVVVVIAFFATLFTATYPSGMWNFMVGVQRWALRVMAYYLFISDKYPPFTLSEQPEDTVRLRAEYPERVSRWRPFFAGLLILPYMIVAALIGFIGQICAFLAFFTILFTKKIPVGIFDVIRISFNWQMRANFYSYWMSTEYPPFEWDDQA